MRVVALFRVSTEKQATEGASLDAQERTYRELARASGWTTVAEFRGHESASQAASDRRVLQQLLACLRDNDVGAVWVIEQSRLTRGDELEVAMLMRELKERGTKIIVRSSVRDLSSIDERFMVGIQSLVDRAEAERIKERMGRGKGQRARQGKKNSGPSAFGYRNPPPGDPGRGTLQVVEAEAAVVRRIFDLAFEGSAPPAIAERLNQEGHPASRGGKWGKTSVVRVLQNPVYYGAQASGVWVKDPKTRTFRRRLRNDRAIVVEGAHPAIVTRELWDAVNSRAPKPRTARPRMLTRLIWINGRRGESDSDGKRAFYRPPRGVAGLPWLEVGDTDERVWAAFVSLATGERFVDGLLKESRSNHDPRRIAEDVRAAEARVEKLRKRESGLIEMRADGDLDREEFNQRMQDVRDGVIASERVIAELKAKARVASGSTAQRVVAAVRNLLAGPSRLTQQQRRRVLDAIVERVEVEAEKVETDFLRDERGRVVPGRTPRWRITRIGFTLRGQDLAAAEERPWANQAATNANDDANDATDAEPRSGQLDTTLSCSAPPAPAKP